MSGDGDAGFDSGDGAIDYLDGALRRPAFSTEVGTIGSFGRRSAASLPADGA
jgi:hypothetical protein